MLRVLRSGCYVLGPETEAFEEELARFVGARFAVAVGSGTAAIALALRALGVGPGDEVLTTPFTHFATVGAILQVGARPVFADIGADDFLIDPEAVAAALGPRTRALLPVHLFGRCADMPRLVALARARGIPVIEDAAQALGAARAGRCAGSWGRAAAFSFYPSKNLGALGDGGALTTDDADLYERLRSLRCHGQSGTLFARAGVNSRLDEIQSAALRAKLPFLRRWNEARARNADIYAAALDGCPDLRRPEAPAGETQSWHQYTLRSPRSGEIRARLDAAGVEWRRYYATPACSEPALGDARPPPGALPRCERACAEALSLPVRGSLAPAEIESIAALVRSALSG